MSLTIFGYMYKTWMFMQHNCFIRSCRLRSVTYCEPCQAKLFIRGMRRQQRPRSECADAHSDLGHRYLLQASLDTIEYANGEQRPGWSRAHAQFDVNPHILRTHKRTFSLDAAQVTDIIMTMVKVLLEKHWRKDDHIVCQLFKGAQVYMNSLYPNRLSFPENDYRCMFT